MGTLPMTGSANPAASDERVELEIATHILRQGLVVAPVVAVAVGPFRGFDGALSVTFAFGLVLVNLLVAAASLGWAARRGEATLMAVALFGFLIRLGSLTLALFLVRDQGWVDLPALGLTVVAAHLGLLFWETRFVSLSLAAPGLRPSRKSFLATLATEK